MDNIIVEVHGELESEFTKRIVSLIHSRIKERYKQDVSCESIKINLAVHECTAPEGFSIEDGDSGSINIAGNDFLGLIYGVGKFLHTSTFNPNAFIPSTWRGTSAPESKIRGVYFATHFFNWYQSASENEIFRYIEDLALWGINCIFLIYPSNKPISRNNDSSDIHQLYKFCRAAKALKLKVGILCEANRQFSEFSEEFWAVKSGQRHKGHLCPNIKEAKEDILRNYRNFLEKFSDIGLEYL